MSLLDRILSIFGGGSSAGDPATPSETEEEVEEEPEEEVEEEPEEEVEEEPEEEVEEEPEEEVEEEPEEEVEEEPEEDEGPEDVPTKDVAAAADPRRRDGEENTVGNRAANPADHGEAAEDAEEEDAEEEDAEEEDAEAEDAEAEEDEGEDGPENVPTKDVAAAADPRRREGEENTVENRAANPDDQRAT
ncbi:hypothetical protein [Haloplanus halophilus]|uniref:hypothetical protein n=1 Tax=Haloplanus halophilus TaxID=2949993 RepID=UPI00203F3F63|nr:hypothetical protein [Haloplanus sp. GDY1]